MTHNGSAIIRFVAAIAIAGAIAIAVPSASFASDVDAGVEVTKSSWTVITNVTETNPESGDYHKSYGWKIVSAVYIADGVVSDVIITGKGIAMPTVPEMEQPYFEPCHFIMEERIVDAKIDATNPDAIDDIDVVSGATQTSYWIKEATKEALVKWNTEKALNADLANASITLKSSGFTYAGKAIVPQVVVTSKTGTLLVEGADYTLTYSNNVAAGTATVTAVGMGGYSGSKSANFTIAPAKQAINPAKAAYKVSFSKVKKGKQKIAVAFKSTSGAKVTYAAAKNGKVSLAKNGKVTVAKGIKKGTYTLKVKATAGAKGNYAKTKLTVKLKVVVK